MLDGCHELLTAKAAERTKLDLQCCYRRKKISNTRVNTELQWLAEQTTSNSMTANAETGRNQRPT